MRVYKYALGALVALPLLGLVTVTTVRAYYLPASACSVSMEKAKGLALERPYAEIRDALGCDGVLVKREELAEKLTREVYAWRGDTWPYARFDALFYNGMLHGKDIHWVSLSTDVPASDAFASEATEYIPPDP